MSKGTWISLLERQSRGNAPVGWDEIVVGHDFGILAPAEIQGWVLDQAVPGPQAHRLAWLAGADLAGFEEVLWAACAESTGKVPRPGGRRWSAAQDRWRVALLKDAMASPLSPEALAVVVESIYERVGCPEDMLGLWQRHSPWQQRQGSADRAAIARFLHRCEEHLHTAV
jgi:hypothetical protein